MLTTASRELHTPGLCRGLRRKRRCKRTSGRSMRENSASVSRYRSNDGRGTLVWEMSNLTGKLFDDDIIEIDSIFYSPAKN